MDLVPQLRQDSAAVPDRQRFIPRGHDGVEPHNSSHDRLGRWASTPGFAWTGAALILVGLAAVIVQLPGLDLRRMTDLGLPSVFTPTLWAATLCVALGSVVGLISGRRPVIVLALAATVLVLPGLTAIAETSTRFVVSWRHMGVVDHLARTGSIDPSIDAYFNWPGFFAFFSFLQEAAGLQDISVIVHYAPIALNVLYLLPLYAIGRATTDDRTTTWVGLWLFASLNWIGQDYFSPQGLYLFVYLVVVAVVVTWFKGNAPRLDRLVRRQPAGGPSGGGPAVDVPGNEESTGRQRAGLVVVLMVVVAATVASHQLTPVAMFLTLAALALLNLTYLRGLPVLVLLLAGAWIAFPAATYFAGHADVVFGGVASLFDSLGQNVTDRVQGSSGHETIVLLRLVAALLLWCLAAWGTWLRWRAGSDVRWAVVPAAVPFVLLALQSYGGEALLRSALFSSPFMCLLAASVFVDPAEGRVRRGGAALLAVVGVAIFVLFPFARWGNERADWYSEEEVQAVRELYETAPDGSVITAVADALPWRAQEYADHDYRLLTLYTPISADDVATEGVPEDETESVDLAASDEELLLAQVRDRMAADAGQCSFLIVSRAQEAYLDQAGPFTAESVQRLEQLVASSGEFQQVVENQDARVYSLGVCAAAAS